MQRRKLLAIGAVSGLVLAAAGGTLAFWRPARVDGRLSEGAGHVLTAVAQAVLAGLLPTEPAALAQALRAHLERMQATLAGLPPAMQGEVDELLALLALPAGRVALTGLATPWHSADTHQVQAALQSLRTSSMALRQQVFHALRDLTNAAHFADAGSWPALGYPGPRPV